MKSFIALSFAIMLLNTGCTQTSSQNKVQPKDAIGGPCEGCEAVFESPVPFEKLESMVWLPDWKVNASRKLAVNGIVYKADGKTRASNVVLYIYHTDQTGIYPTKGNEKGWDKRHGYLRGWLRTDDTGFYKFFTLRPAPYPGATIPAHIHVFVKEPDKAPYWIDDFVFDDDPLLTTQERSRFQNRGGSGILKFRRAASEYGDGPVKSERDIYLGKNVENYP